MRGGLERPWFGSNSVTSVRKDLERLHDQQLGLGGGRRLNATSIVTEKAGSGGGFLDGEPKGERDAGVFRSEEENETGNNSLHGKLASTMVPTSLGYLSYYVL